MFFHVWEKWHVQSEAIEVREFRAKIQIQRDKFFSKSFSRKKV